MCLHVCNNCKNCKNCKKIKKKNIYHKNLLQKIYLIFYSKKKIISFNATLVLHMPHSFFSCITCHSVTQNIISRPPGVFSKKRSFSTYYEIKNIYYFFFLYLLFLDVIKNNAVKVTAAAPIVNCIVVPVLDK